jgi:hypothetical protein
VNCARGPKFSFSELAPILPTMHLMWPSLGKQTDKALWQQEVRCAFVCVYVYACTADM